MSENKLNIFDVLKSADRHDYDFYSNLTDEQKKEFSPWLIQRWIASRKLELVNEITNPLIGNVPKEMAWKLFCAIGVPRISDYKFIAPPKKLTTRKNAKVIDVVAGHYGVSTKVASTYVKLLSNDAIIGMAETQGMDDKEIKELKKILKE